MVSDVSTYVRLRAERDLRVGHRERDNWYEVDGKLYSLRSDGEVQSSEEILEKSLGTENCGIV